MSFWTKKAAGVGPKKYGLVKKQGSKVASIFGGADDDDAPVDPRAEMNARLKAQEAAQQRRAAAQAAKAAQVDPSIYDYDGVYDDMKAQELEKATARAGLKNAGGGGTKKPGARYIGALQQACRVREREFDRVYERQLLKEQEQEKAEFGETERFVTAAYKKQLQESRKWDAEDARMDALEEKTSAPQSGMHGFYSNLLTKNIAAGADVDKNALSSYTHGSRRNAQMEPAAEPPAPASDASVNAAAALASFDAAAADEPLDEEAQKTKEEAARKARSAFLAARGYADVAERVAEHGVDAEAREVIPKRKAPEPEPPRPDGKAAAAAARERYLARKKAKQGG